MRSHTVQKRILSTTLLFLLTLCLVSMGMRVPAVTGISSSAKPKPTPRAVVQNQIKTCKQIIKELSGAEAIVRLVVLTLPELVHSADFRVPFYSKADIVRCIPSRASPLFA